MTGGALLSLALLLLPAAALAAGKDFRSVYDKAQKLYAAGSYSDALAAYEAAYAIKPAPEATYGIARCHHQLGAPEAAAAAYEKFLAEAPAHEAAPKARGHLVTVLAIAGDKELAAGDFAAARKSFERALALHAAADAARTGETSGALLTGYGEALAGAGERSAAAAALKGALAAALAPGVRARAEAKLAEIDPKSADAVPPSEAVSARDEDERGGAGGGAGAGLWLGIGGGALAVAAVTVLVVVLVVRPGRPDLGWYDYYYGN